MATLPLDVRPGDLITALWMNQLLDKVAEIDSLVTQLSGGTGTGSVTVPSLFGRSLSDAVAAITQPAVQLSLGNALDALGNLVNPATDGTRLVLSQVPVAGARASPGSSVNFVVSAVASSGPATNPAPAINLISPASAAVGASIQILGSGFLGVASTVTIGGVNAPVLSTSSVSTLFVNVPTGIPGAPTTSSGSSKSGVAVVVTNPGSQSAQSTITVLPPLANPITLTQASPTSVQVGKVLTLTGSGFDATSSSNTVTFDTVTATATSGSTTQLSVTVPAGIPGLAQSGDTKKVNVSVKRGSDKASAGPIAVTVYI